MEEWRPRPSEMKKADTEEIDKDNFKKRRYQATHNEGNSVEREDYKRC